MSDNVILSTHSLHKAYGKGDSRFEALRGINLEIKQGESVAIIGKSGSGKSTLMHLLALLDKPTKGSIELDGENTSKLRQKRLNQLRNKKFGFVFQSFFMNANDTVLNNVILPLKIAGVRPDTVLNNVILPLKIAGVRPGERRRRAMHALKIVGLEDKAKNKANDLSGGQKQRVCIARAIVNDPEIIFADEPTGNLDSVTGEKVEKILFELNKKKGITLIIVTHDADLASKCDRQIRITDGRVVNGESAEDKDIAYAKKPPTYYTHDSGDTDADGMIDILEVDA